MKIPRSIAVVSRTKSGDDPAWSFGWSDLRPLCQVFRQAYAQGQGIVMSARIAIAVVGGLHDLIDSHRLGSAS